VFEGRVDSVQTADGSGMVRYELAVQRVFKGELQATTWVVTRASSAACGRSFVQGKRYLVYAHRSGEGDLGDTMCSRTRPISTADEDLAALGAGAPPPAPATPETQSREPPRIEPPAAPPALEGPAPTTRKGCDLAGPSGPGALALVLVGTLLGRRRRPGTCATPRQPTPARKPQP
jgi:MYXO-CTERM domain-containing protein